MKKEKEENEKGKRGAMNESGRAGGLWSGEYQEAGMSHSLVELCVLRPELIRQLQTK